MSVMPQARILVYADEVPDELVASHRSSIEASGMRVLGEPEIRRVPNDGYITTPDAPSECYLVICQVGPAESL